ncbi:MAG: DegV family protein [Acetatifactor sp.]|jgi:DegV family protein with EDD domain|nr:DegV family protein [Acetatifactor sp.]
MSYFEIFTDSSCDLPQNMIEKYHLQVMQLEVFINDNPPVLNNQIDATEFYDLLRKGANAKTAAVTPGFFEEHMRKSLEDGKDILYIGFSSGLSVTYNNGALILQELMQEYPERKVLFFDSLCATGGQGLLVYYAALLREAGKSIEEVKSMVESLKDRVHHLVTVDNLFFLQRGGRIPASTAILGTALQIKPIIVVDKDGKLQNVSKARGRRGAIKTLFKMMQENAAMDELPYVFITHSDCKEDAELLADMVREELGPKEIIISDIGPVIGAHTGPGGLVLCYLAKTEKGQ